MARSSRHTPQLQVAPVARPRRQRYLQREVARFRRPLRIFGGAQHRRQIPFSSIRSWPPVGAAVRTMASMSPRSASAASVRGSGLCQGSDLFAIQPRQLGVEQWRGASTRHTCGSSLRSPPHPPTQTSRLCTRDSGLGLGWSVLVVTVVEKSRLQYGSLMRGLKSSITPTLRHAYARTSSL